MQMKKDSLYDVIRSNNDFAEASVIVFLHLVIIGHTAGVQRATGSYSQLTW